MSIEKERGFRQRNEISADRLPGKPWGTIRTVGLIVVMGSVLAVASPSPSAGNLLSWEIWNEPSLLAEIDPEVRVVTTTSAAPGDGALDRHSAGDSRFLRVENGEGVIFETADAGAITRIWMVQGDGVSEDLDPDIRLRIRLDGASNPIVDLPLPVFFSGRTPPFVEPMVLDRRRSGGGNVCFVPIAFRKGCRVSLTGAKEAKIWFQVSAVVLDDPAGITTFDGTEDLEEWRRMLERPGTDPWLDTIEVMRRLNAPDESTVSAAQAELTQRGFGPVQLALAKRLFDMGVSAAKRKRELRAEGRRSLVTDLKVALADRIVFSKIREKFGGRLQFSISSSAALSPKRCDGAAVRATSPAVPQPGIISSRPANFA